MILLSKLILLCINFSILSFLAVLLYEHVRANHDLTSWAFFYHVLAFLFLTIRGFFWLLTIISTTNWDVFTFYFLYWIPNPIEFGSFLILPLFLLQILYPADWKKHWPFWRPVYVGCMVSLVVFQVIWSLLSVWDERSEDNSGGDSNNSSSRSSDSVGVEDHHTESVVSGLFRWMNAVSFFILSLVQMVYALEVRNMDEKTFCRHFLTSKTVINYVNSVLILSFITRSLYQLAAIFDLVLLPDIPLQGYEDIDFVIVIFFTLWDYIPTILIIITITSRAIGNTKDKPLTNSVRKNKKPSKRLSGSKSGISNSSSKRQQSGEYSLDGSISSTSAWD